MASSSAAKSNSLQTEKSNHTRVPAATLILGVEKESTKAAVRAAFAFWPSKLELLENTRVARGYSTSYLQPRQSPSRCKNQKRKMEKCKQAVAARNPKRGVEASRGGHKIGNTSAPRTIPLPSAYSWEDFYLSTGHYSLVNSCNNWTARALRAACCPIAPQWCLLPQIVMWRARHFGHVIWPRRQDVTGSPPSDFASSIFARMYSTCENSKGVLPKK